MKSAAPAPDSFSETQREFAWARERFAAGDAAAALARLRPLLERQPSFVEGWHLAGVAALQAGDLRLAVMALERGAQLAPQQADLLNNLAAAYLRLARYAEAEQAAGQAQKLVPQKAGPLINRGSALQALGRLDEAVSCTEAASALDPDRPEVWNNLGNLYKEQGRVAEAIKAYDRALEIEPMLREPFSNKLALLKLDPEQTPESLLATHREFSRRHEFPLLAHYRPIERQASPARVLRIGYVSPDCHSAVPAFLRPVLRAHDPQVVQVYCYFNNPQRPETDPAIARQVIARVMLGQSDEQVAAAVRADGIDILVDIAGHTGKNRLGVFMRRPAPIQMTWLDYLGSTGLLSMDYRITDAVADPPGLAEAGHTETLLRLAHPQWCWEPPVDAPAVAALPALSAQHFTLGSFNNYPKLTDATLGLWARILQALPKTRLLAVGVAEGAAQERVRDALGVAFDRVSFLPRLSPREYREAFASVDLALDPMPFSGATTTLDGLWQGVPVLTLPGTTSASRSSASILSGLGLQAFIARDADHYLQIVEECCLRPEPLAKLRDRLREDLLRSSLLDARPFTRALEALYRDAWRVWCETKPRPLALAASGEALLASRWRAADLAWQEAQAHLAQAELERGIHDCQQLLREHQNWILVQQALASAALAWAQRHPESLEALSPKLTPFQPTPRVSIIICSVDEAKFAEASASYRERFAAVPHEIVAIRDARSLAEGFNRGARLATGEIFIFSHDDVLLLTPDFAQRLLAHLRHWDGIGVCGTSRLTGANWTNSGQPFLHGHIVHQPAGEKGLITMVLGCAPEVQAVEGIVGAFVAVRREVWEHTAFDEAGCDGFHLYDLDFSLRASRAGFRLGIPMDLTLLHRSMGSYGRVWRKDAAAFEGRFKKILAPAHQCIPGYLHCRLSDFKQVQLLLAGLLFFRYGGNFDKEPSGDR